MIDRRKKSLIRQSRRGQDSIKRLREILLRSTQLDLDQIEESLTDIDLRFERIIEITESL